MANTRETAPKDGTPILIWHDWNGEKYWVFARWVDGEWLGDSAVNHKENPLYNDWETYEQFFWIPQPPPPEE